MANIKNFGLVGVAADVQFGKAGPRLINETNVFTFKNAAGSAAAPITAGNAIVAGLTVGASGSIDMGANKVANVAAGVADTDAVNFKQLTDGLAAANTFATDGIAALNTEVTAVEAALGLNTDGTLAAFVSGSAAFGTSSYKAAIEAVGAAVVAEASRATTAEGVLTTDLATEVARATAAEGVLTTDLASEVARATAAEATKLNLAGGTMTGALILSADPSNSMGAATKNYVDSVAGGLTWQSPVVNKVADITARDALTGLGAGARILVDADKKIYTYNGSAFDAGTMPGASWALFDQADQQGWVFNGSVWVQFTGTGQIVAGLGMVKVGNRLDVQLSEIGGLHFAPDEVGADSTLTLKLDGSSLTMTADGVKVSAALTTEIAALRTDLSAEAVRAAAAEGVLTTNLAAEVTRATGAEGTLTTNLGLEVTRATGAETALGGRITTLEGLVSGNTADMQTEIDLMETSIGLAADGAFVPFVGSTYLGSVSTVVGSLAALDVALKAMDVAYKAADVTLQGNITSEVNRATAAEIANLAEAKTYADGLNTTMLTYVDGKVTMLEGEVTAAIATAAADATTKSAQALTDAKAYADSKVAAGVENAARAIYVEFDAATGSEITVGSIKGFVHRIKVYITTAASTDSSVQVGTTSVNNQLASTADVDSSVVGLYNLEVNQVYGTTTALKVFMANGAKGTVVIEYLSPAAA